MSAPAQTESRLQHARSLLHRELRPMLRLALPLVIAEIGWMSMTIVDTIMVGRLPHSAVAMGGVSLGSGLYYTVAIFGSGLLLGLDTVVSHAFGRRDLIDAKRSLVTGVALAVCLAPLMMLVIALWPPLMQAIGVAPDVLAQMKPFLRALNWSTLPLVLYFAMRRYLQAVNVVRPVTFALISANIVNALFNWVFIFGHLGSPAYGVAGSGWSTCFARVYMALVMWIAVLRFQRDHPVREQVRVEFARVRRLLRLG